MITRSKKLQMEREVNEKKQHIDKKSKKRPFDNESMIDEDPKCCICLDCVNDIAKVNNCCHEFCFDCITKWSKTSNTCPICQERFQEITRSKTNKHLRRKKKKTTETVSIPFTDNRRPTMIRFSRELASLHPEIINYFNSIGVFGRRINMTIINNRRYPIDLTGEDVPSQNSSNIISYSTDDPLVIDDYYIRSDPPSHNTRSHIVNTIRH